MAKLQQHQSHKTFQSMSSKSCEYYYFVNNLREAGTGTLLFLLHYTSGTLWIGFTDNLRNKLNKTQSLIAAHTPLMQTLIVPLSISSWKPEIQIIMVYRP